MTFAPDIMPIFRGRRKMTVELEQDELTDKELADLGDKNIAESNEASNDEKKLTKDVKLTMIAEQVMATSFDKERKKKYKENKIKPFFNGILSLRDSREFLIYTDKKGIWEENKETELEVAIAKKIDDSLSPTNMKHVLDKIRRFGFITRDKVYRKTDFLAVINGVVHLKQFTIQKHTPLGLLTVRIPVFYDPDATCPAIDDFIASCVNEEDIELIWEFIGYTLLHDYSIRKALFVHGEGANGKSMFLEMITKFLGNENCSSVNLAQLSRNNSSADYYVIQLLGKMANICTDVSNETIHSTGVFKQLVGGNDKITARGIYESPVSFYNVAKMIFSSNELPKAENDDGKAFMKRMITVEFPNTFEENSEIGDKIMKAITSPDEQSGMLNKALVGLMRLMNRKGRFDTSAKNMKYAMLSDPLQAFIDRECIFDANTFCSKQVFYERYVEFCKRNRLKILKPNVLGKVMKNDKKIESSRDYDERDTRIYVYRGIHLKRWVDLEESHELDIQDELEQFK